MNRLLIVLNILLVLFAFAWPLGLFVSLFLFDSPGSETSSLTYGFALSLWFFPISIIWGSGRFFKHRKTHDIKAHIGNTLFSAIGPALIILFIVLIDLVCEGKLACN